MCAEPAPTREQAEALRLLDWIAEWNEECGSNEELYRTVARCRAAVSLLVTERDALHAQLVAFKRERTTFIESRVVLVEQVDALTRALGACGRIAAQTLGEALAGGGRTPTPVNLDIDPCPTCGAKVGERHSAHAGGLGLSAEPVAEEGITGRNGLFPHRYYDTRDPECVKRWPECESGAYNPSCCRFPKSCSCESHSSPGAADVAEAGKDV